MAPSTTAFTALLIQACLAPLVLAGEVTIAGNAMSQGGAAGGGILGLLVLFIDVFIFCMFVAVPCCISPAFSLPHPTLELPRYTLAD